MPSQQTNDYLNRGRAKENSQSAIDQVSYCLVTDFFAFSTAELSHDWSPHTRGTAASIELAQRLDSFGGSLISDDYDRDEAQTEQE
jgi:hypothetical protein